MRYIKAITGFGRTFKELPFTEQLCAAGSPPPVFHSKHWGRDPYGFTHVSQHARRGLADQWLAPCRHGGHVCGHVASICWSQTNHRLIDPRWSMLIHISPLHPRPHFKYVMEFRGRLLILPPSTPRYLGSTSGPLGENVVFETIFTGV